MEKGPVKLSWEIVTPEGFTEVNQFGRLYDGAGNEIELDVIRCDTETGETWCLLLDKDGSRKLDDKGFPLVALYKFVPPLKFVPL
jgi:hypothetical protein